jgi:hypothetical protein
MLPKVYFDVSIAGTSVGRIIAELRSGASSLSALSLAL